ncbi:MAG: hypothetical protein WCI18_13335 [Pseudomonadota bacterium]
MLDSKNFLSFALVVFLVGCRSVSEPGEEGSKDQKGKASALKLEDSQGATDSSETSKNPPPKTTLTNKVGKFIGGLAEGVTSTVTSVASSVGEVILGGEDKSSKALADSRDINFLQLGTGGYRGKVESASTAIVMNNLESVMNFLKDAEFAHTQFVFNDWLSFDFEKYQAIAVVHNHKKRGSFLKVDRLTYNGTLVVTGESYQEDSSCSLNEWISSEVSFSLLKIPKVDKLPAGAATIALSAPERKGCHGMLGSFQNGDQAKGISHQVEWQGQIEKPTQRLHIYRSTWGDWDDFTSKSCKSCRSIETRYGFPSEKLAIQVTEAGQGHIHIRKIFKLAGMYFLDLERDDCPVSVNSILFTILKKDVETTSSLFDYSKVLMTGPWIPTTRKCEAVNE